MFWILFAILAGFFVALSDALNKKFLSSSGYPYMVIARTLGALPFLFPFFVYLTLSQHKFIYFTPKFILVVFVLLCLELLAALLYMRGIQVSDLSLTLPFLSFTPVLIILTGYIFLKEKISLIGASGILFIVLGSYFINLPSIKKGWLAPFKAIKKEKGSFLLLQVAFIYSITSVLGKKGLLLTDPLWFACFYFSILGVFATFGIKVIYKVSLSKFLKKHYKAIALVGFTQALMCFCHMIALSHIETAYMIALKRTSILFAVLLGYIMFRESHFILRLSSVILMLIGILIITFFK